MRMKKILLLIITLLFLLSPLLAEEKYGYELLSSAMKANNTTLEQAYRDLQKSQLDTKDAKGAYGPTIEGMSTFTYMANPPIGRVTVSADELMANLNYPAGAPRPTGYVTLYEGMPNTYYNNSISITQPVFTWGKITNAVKLFTEVEQVRSVNIRDTENKLSTELKTRLCAIYYLKEMKAVLDEQRELASQLVKLCEDAKENGLMLDIDVKSAQMQAQEVELGYVEIDSNLENILAGLQTLTGVADLTEADITYTPNDEEINKVIAMSAEELVQVAIAPTQPALQMLSGLETIAEKKTKIAKGSIYYKPDFAIQASVNYSGTRLIGEKGWYQNNDWGFNLTFAIKTTFWDGGKKMHDITRGKLEEEDARTDYQAAVNTISQTIKENRANIELMEAKIAYESLKVETNEAKLKLQQLQYEVGTLGKEETLKTELEINNSKLSILKYKTERAQNAYLIGYLTGQI